MISWTTSSIVRTWPLWHGLLELAVLYPADYRGLTSGLRMPNIVLTALSSLIEGCRSYLWASTKGVH